MGLFKKQGRHARPEDADQAVDEQAGAEELNMEQSPDLPDGQADDASAPDSAGGSALAASVPVIEPVAAAVSVTADPGVGEVQFDELAGEQELAYGEVAAVGAYAGIDLRKRRKQRALKAFGITFGVIIGLILAAYIVGAIVFMGRFLPNTVMGSYDLSMKTDEEVVQILDDAAASYQLDIAGGNFSYRTTGEQIDASVDAEGIVKAMHEDLNAWTWPVLIFQTGHDESSRLVASFDEKALSDDLTQKLNSFNEGAQDPVNATIVYDEKSKSYQVKPEEAGTKWDVSSVIAVASEAIPELQPKVTLASEQLIQPTVLSTDEKLIESAQIATGLVSADIVMWMGGEKVGEVNGESLSAFVSIDEKLDVTFNDEALNAWVEELAEGYNTIGTERSYVRGDGKEITVEGGSYGWEIDTETLRDMLIENIKAGEKTEIEVPCWSTAAVYNGPGQPDWGNRYIDVDISEQYVRFYGDDGSIIWESPCITGAPDGKHDTVPGVWYINNKESPSKLIGYENKVKIYETTVTYWMAFESSEIGLHDANWQPSFGGSMYAQGYGSHGCVNLPVSAAAELYDICSIGDVVIVHS